jgi:hypothetical protein
MPVIYMKFLSAFGLTGRAAKRGTNRRYRKIMPAIIGDEYTIIYRRFYQSYFGCARYGSHQIFDAGTFYPVMLHMRAGGSFIDLAASMQVIVHPDAQTQVLTKNQDEQEGDRS